MELVMFGKEMLQNGAEQVASYRVGQTILRQLDRALWVVEKSARWAVPPPLDQDERPQPELIRPLPWVFFLILLVLLRIIRESISLFNLVMGKPPLSSADMVMYIVSKRRYLRTLKYQGNRMMRARTSTSQPPQGWMSKIQSLFEVTMCFRRHNYGNNNTSTNNEELLVIKRSKRPREPASPTSPTETSMERLIEKMMVDLDADSDEDSSYTLTNATSARSDRSDTAESDQEAVTSDTLTTQEEASSIKTDGSSTKSEPSPTKSGQTPTKSKETPTNPELSPVKKDSSNPNNSPNKEEYSTPDEFANSTPEKTPNDAVCEEKSQFEHQLSSPKTESQVFLQCEKRSTTKIQTAKSEQKIGNPVERRDADAPVTRKADMSF